MITISKGATDKGVPLYIVDTTNLLPATGLAFNSSGIDLWYRRTGAAKTSLTEVAGSLTVHADGGFVEVANGNYWLDLPDAAWAAGVDLVVVGGTITGYKIEPVIVRLETPTLDALLVNHTIAGSAGKAIADILVDTGTSIPDAIDDLDVGDATTQPRINRKPDPGFTIQVSRRADRTYKCTKPIPLTAGEVEDVYVFIDMSPLFGAENFVETVGECEFSAGSVTQDVDNGPRDTYAVIELGGTADEDCEVTVPVTMESGTTVPVVFDVEVLGD